MLPNLQILKEDNRDITKLYINAEFSIAGQIYTDTLFLGDWNQHYGLALTGMGGTLGSNGWWTGNFLTVQYHGVDTTIDPGLLAFLNILYVFCVFGSAAAGEAMRAFPIKGDPQL